MFNVNQQFSAFKITFVINGDLLILLKEKASSNNVSISYLCKFLLKNIGKYEHYFNATHELESLKLNKNVTVYMYIFQYRQLEEIAKLHKTTKSKLLRKLVYAYLIS